MVGLLLKDFYSTAKTVKTYLIIIVLYAIIFGLMEENGTAVIASVIIVAMAPITALAYDEQSKFDKLAGTMPVSPKQIVLSKYILGFLLCCMSVAVSSGMMCVVSFFTDNGKETIAAIPEIALLSIIVTIFYHSFLFPIIYKFGTTKGRIYTMLIMVFPVVIGFLAATVVSGVLTSFALIGFAKYLILAAPLLLILLYIGSIALSVKIYKKKDF